jgi:hypothetical protein
VKDDDEAEKMRRVVNASVERIDSFVGASTVSEKRKRKQTFPTIPRSHSLHISHPAKLSTSKLSLMYA